MNKEVLPPICFILLLFIAHTDAVSIGNGPLPLMALSYLTGSIRDLPGEIVTPPQNTNDSLGYRVYTQDNPDQPCFLEPTKEEIEKCSIDPNNRLVMFVAGFLEEFRPGNLYEVMKDKILANGPYTIIILDWSKYNGPPITSALANMQKIGPLAAEVLRNITIYAGVPPENMKLVGHSLGAHLVGNIGRNVPNLGIIDSLDPNWQGFETPEEFIGLVNDTLFPKISPEDATFVRVYHSSQEKTSFGITRPLGYIDIYVNGGISQPHCKFGARFQRTSGDWVTVNSAALMYICPHEIMNNYFIDSMNNTNCMFKATLCNSYEGFKSGRCRKRNRTPVVIDTGFYGEPVTGLPKYSKFFYNPLEDPPYCCRKGYKPGNKCNDSTNPGLLRKIVNFFSG